MRSSFEEKRVPVKKQKELWDKYHTLIAGAASAEAGQLGESDGLSFLFGFPSPDSALRYALTVQDLMMVKQPIFGPIGAFRVRMAAHSPSPEAEQKITIEELRSIAVSAVRRTPEGEILVTSTFRDGVTEPFPNTRFSERRPPLEVSVQAGRQTSVSVFGLLLAERYVTVNLTPAERTALFAQDPNSRTGGGFQALLVSLQEKVQGNRLDLDISDRERIARYAHDYRSGGWQNRLKEIFGRTLGNNLGRGEE